MQVDELRAALREAAAGQPPVSATAKRDIHRRVFRRRVAGGVLTLAVVGAAAGAVVSASGHSRQQGIRVATQPGATPATTVVPTPTTVSHGPPLALPLQPMPAGFGAQSVTFVSAGEGWALGAVNCSYGATRCPAVLARTTDGGRSWSAAAPPQTTLSPAPDAAAGIWQVRFADARDGWAFGPELWATHDGGAHWSRSSLKNVYALEAGAGTVHAVVFDQANPSFRIESSPIGRDMWTRSATSLTVGAGPVPAIQLVLSGPAGWIVENDRLFITGARLVNGLWQPWKPPWGTTAGGPAYLTATSATQVVAACEEGVWTGPAISDHLYVSSDGGATFQRSATAVPGVQDMSSIASPSPSVAFVASSNTNRGIAGTFDGGTTWQLIYPARTGITLVGFTTPQQGIAVLDTGALLMTRDGGHTWAVVPFR
jgi:photosystem II stability/assembly factor-like uncharacterized protein